MPPTIVLVHGAFAESSSWDRVIDPLFLIGEDNRIIPPELQRYMAERAGSKRTVLVEGASHAICVSQPEATARLVLEAAASLRAVV